MSERRISILIESKGDVSGIDRVTASLGKMEAQGDQLFAALKAGVAIDIGGRLVSSIARITQHSTLNTQHDGISRSPGRRPRRAQHI